MDETERAIRTYNKLLLRYPDTKYEPEVLYNLYLIYKERKDAKNMDRYKELLFAKHPNSIYSKLIRNPNYYRDTKIANKYAEAEYRSVYELYKNNNFNSADSLASIIITKYPDSDILDKLVYINILCKIKSGESLEKAQEEIQAFVEQFAESKLLPLVIDLSEAIKNRNSVPTTEQTNDLLKESDLQPGTNTNAVPDLKTLETNP